MSSEVGAIRGSTSAKHVRRARARRLLRRIAIWVGLPTLLAIGYYGIWATPQYESIAVFTVQSNKGSAGSLDGLSALLPGVSSSPRDAMLVREFALSRTMLTHLGASADLGSEDVDVVLHTGVGAILQNTLAFRRWDKAGMTVLVIILVTILIDYVSAAIRRRIIEGADRRIAQAEVFEQPGPEGDSRARGMAKADSAAG